jgi:glutathione S-transferase
MSHLHLMSHELCPYVQRAAILLHEKNVIFQQTYIDLANKPAWFLEISPLGKVPVLKVDDEVLFESAVICEYLDETHGFPLHPSQPMPKAKHRAWMEFSSVLLTGLWNLSMAQDEATLERKRQDLNLYFATLEANLGPGPYFAGSEFSMVDVFFAPVFRYFDVFDTLRDLRLFEGRPRVAAWRQMLAARSAVQRAVPADYAARLLHYLKDRESILTGRS